MEKVPKVSVVIPVFNGAEYLAEAIASAVGQTRPPAEVLVFDNGSTDASRQVALELLPPTAVTTFERNVGAVTNFNRSARAASGDFLLWLAADDRLSPRHLEICTEALIAHPTSPGCLPGIRFIDQQGAELRVHSDPELASSEPATRLRAFLRRPRWTEFYCLYRRESLLSSPMVLPEFGADVLLTWWFLLRGPLTVVEEPLLEYRVYPQKTIADMAASLNPDAPACHWRKIRMWCRLREMAADPALDAETARAARRALATCLAHSTWIGHLTEDLILRWPRAARPLHRAAVLIRRQTRSCAEARARRRQLSEGHEGR